MKSYLLCLKQFNKIFCVFLLVLLLGQPFLVQADTPTAPSIETAINQKNSDIAELEQEIAAYQAQLDALGQQKDSLNTSLQELDVTKKNLDANITIAQKKIDSANLALQGLTANIDDKQTAISTDLNSIALGIEEINQSEQQNFLVTLLSQDDFTKVWNDINSTMTLRDDLNKNIAALMTAKVQLQNTKQQVVTTKNQLTTLHTQLADQQKIVVQNANDKAKLLKQTKDSEANYQKLLKTRLAERDAFEKELEDYEAQLKFVLNPTLLPSGRVLSWPLDKIYVTQLFGKTVDSKRLYASGTHNGVDFRAAVGTPVMSMADGTVLGTGDTDLTCYGASYGKFVFIQYTDGLSSTFGHLSLIKATVGEQVTRGEVVGYSGATGHVTGPHLHVSLYASQAVKMDTKPSAACDGRTYTLPVAPVNAYLDALQYLPPYTVNTSTLTNETAE